MMKRILFAISLSICMEGTVTAQQKNMSMKSYENEVRKDTIDTLGDYLLYSSNAIFPR